MTYLGWTITEREQRRNCIRYDAYCKATGDTMFDSKLDRLMARIADYAAGGEDYDPSRSLLRRM